jgi:hypothetical protein
VGKTKEMKREESGKNVCIRRKNRINKCVREGYKEGMEGRESLKWTVANGPEKWIFHWAKIGQPENQVT